MRDMLSVASLLNPLPAVAEHQNRLPSPSSTLYSPEASPRAPQGKKQKLCKDEATFVKGKPQVEVKYWPCEDQDEQAAAEHKKYKVYPIGQIVEYCKHVPYRSEKKTFLSRTGREGFHVFQYTFQMPHEEKRQTVMWDYNNGLVRITPFFKALEYSKVSDLPHAPASPTDIAKTMPARMLSKNPGLREICHSITGGSLAAQGYWMPFDAAKAVASTFCYRIRYVLTPIFGLDFPAQCIAPGSTGFDSMHIAPKIIRDCIEAAKGNIVPRRETQTSSSRPETPSSAGVSSWTAANVQPKSHKRFDSESGYGTDTEHSDAYPYIPMRFSPHGFKSLATPRSTGGKAGYKKKSPAYRPSTPPTRFEYDSDMSDDGQKRKRTPRRRFIEYEYDSSASDSSDTSLRPLPAKRIKASNAAPIMAAENTAPASSPTEMESVEDNDAANILCSLRFDSPPATVQRLVTRRRTA
ncbi:MAG: hypothetical protein Q9174_004175 [Haloplaca sp. 1 TL-2023]